jgi:hypothetical protein
MIKLDLHSAAPQVQNLEVWVNLFLTCVLDGLEWATIYLGRFIFPSAPGKKPDTQWSEAGWPQSQNEHLGENSLAPAGIQISDHLAPSPVAIPVRNSYHCAFVTA